MAGIIYRSLKNQENEAKKDAIGTKSLFLSSEHICTVNLCDGCESFPIKMLFLFFGLLIIVGSKTVTFFPFRLCKFFK